MAADITATLDSSDGSSAFSIKDASSTIMGSVDSDGNFQIKGGMRLDAGGAECISPEVLIVDGQISINHNSPGDFKLRVYSTASAHASYFQTVTDGYYAGYFQGSSHGLCGDANTYSIVGYARTAGGNAMFASNTATNSSAYLATGINGVVAYTAGGGGFAVHGQDLSTNAIGRLGVGNQGVWGSTPVTGQYGGYFGNSTDGGYVLAGYSGHGVYGIGATTSHFGAGGYNAATGAFCYTGYSTHGCYSYGVSGGYDYYAAGPGTDWGSSSSIRWKKNITPIEQPLAKVQSLRGVYYDWDEEHGGGHDLGMIAEEVGAVLPEIVVFEKDSEYAQAMDYSRLTPLLVEAVKEQQHQFEQKCAALLDEISTLKARISELEQGR
ncbi:MAG: tail fiber domain-containing protein [Candidatus Wallbacteria bacterium]|nr:tail fiber domain-containing protein [Candidatus Wallbacteria bacterium]